MERDGRPAIATFFVDGSAAPVVGATLGLGPGAAHHARVRRIAVGESVRLTNGAGVLATGRIARLGKSEVDVIVEKADRIAPPPALHLFVPIADRDRMLWLAEKVAELAVSVWQPVRFQRSRSVAPRGDGESFVAKVRARMVAAVEQSAGAWIPQLREEISVNAAASIAIPLDRFVLDQHARPLIRYAPFEQKAAVVVGPEGGMEAEELSAFVDHGWRPASLGSTTLRFETAAVAALAVLRAHLTPDQEI